MRCIRNWWTIIETDSNLLTIYQRTDKWMSTHTKKDDLTNNVKLLKKKQTL